MEEGPLRTAFEKAIRGDGFFYGHNEVPGRRDLIRACGLGRGAALEASQNHLSQRGVRATGFAARAQQKGHTVAFFS